jgi:hypothetical protein
MCGKIEAKGTFLRKGTLFCKINVLHCNAVHCTLYNIYVQDLSILNMIQLPVQPVLSLGNKNYILSTCKHSRTVHLTLMLSQTNMRVSVHILACFKGTFSIILLSALR